MNRTQHPQMSLRRALTLRVGGLVIGTLVLVGTAIALLGLRPMTLRIAETQFDGAAAGVAAQLSITFAPIDDLLRMSRDWIGDQAPDIDQPESFNRLFQPVLAALPQITSVVAGTSTGQGWLLLEQADGGWRNRITDIPRWGKRHLIIDRSPSGDIRQSWQDLDYDARARPWYTGTLSPTGEGPSHWTPPYTFYTTGDPGITASTRWTLRDGRDFVIGFDLMLRDLSKATMQARVGRHGLALVTTDSGQLLAMPAAPAGIEAADWLKHILQPTSSLGLAPITDALTHWRQAGQASGRVFAFRSGLGDWLARIDPYPLGAQRFWVVTLAPAADFAPDWGRVIAALLAGTLSVLLLSIVVVRSLVARIARPLESLAEAGGRTGGTESSAGRPVSTNIVEVAKISAAQAATNALLERDQEKLAAQERELRLQIEALRDAQLKLRESEQYFRTLANGGRALIWTAGTDKLCNYFNEPWLRFTGRTLEQEMGNGWTEGVHPDDIDRCLTIYTTAFDQREPFSMDYRLRHVSGEYRWLQDDGEPRYDSQGGFLGYIGFCLDITERKQAEEKIRRLGYFDVLTGLPNRRLLLDRLGQALIASRRSREFGALIMLDLDHFKILNDTQGHDGGDRLLVQVAERLLTCVRGEDTVARLGGDEYVVMLESLGATEDLAARQTEQIAEKIRYTLNQPYALGDSGDDLHHTASLGVTLFGGTATSTEILLKQADMALYKAKDAGRNAVRFFNPTMQAAVDEHARIEAGLRQALGGGEFVLHYQPQIAASTNQIVAVEALVRWQRADGLLPPARFIPIAEECGLIVPIGEWVLAEACRQLADWKSVGIMGLRMAVNVSARQLHSPQLIEHVQSALTRNGLTGDELELEVTESTAMRDPEQAIELMRALRELGVRLAVDDFGTGYSSLTHLRRLPIQTLKLDRSFVQDIEHDDNDAAICAATISLARNLGLKVVAEGVETPAQRYFLSTVHRCELLQGNLFSPPLPAAAVHPLLATRHASV